MAVRPGRGSGSRRLDQAAPEKITAEIVLPKRPLGAILLPVSVPGTNSGLPLVAAGLRKRGFATLVAELLSAAEASHGYHHLDFDLLAERIADATKSLRRKAHFKDLPIGYFAVSTDAAAIATAAADPDCPAGALVMCDARPELASTELPLVRAPTLFIVEDDELALDLNRSALSRLCCPGDLVVLRGMGTSLASPDIASEAARLAADWFETHLRREGAG